MDGDTAPAAEERVDAVDDADDFFGEGMFDGAVVDGMQLVEVAVQRPKVQVFQVLKRMNKSQRTVRLHDDEETSYEAGTLIQWFDVWLGGLPRGNEGVEGAALDVFAVESPTVVDLCALVSYRSLRTEVSSWSSRVSDLDGCTQLYEPKSMDTSNVDLLSDSCPSAIVLEALAARGWIPSRGPTPHRAEEPDATRLTFYRRPRTARKAYFQCLLDLEGLFAAGVAALHVREPLSYYRCLQRLPDKNLVPHGQKDKTYLAMLSAGSAAPVLARLAAAEPLPALADGLAAEPLPALADGQLDLEAIVGDDEDEVGPAPASVPPLPPPLLPPPLAGSPVCSGSAEDDTDEHNLSESAHGSSARDANSVILGDASEDEAPVPVPMFIDGRRVHEDHHVRRDGSSYHRLLIFCGHHPGCSRRRNFGDRSVAEVVAFLRLWHQAGSTCTIEQHRGFIPPAADVAALASDDVQ